MKAQSPDFDSIKQISPYGTEYWSARDLAPLLGYNKWQNFEVAIERAMIACEQVGQIVKDHFTDASKMVDVGSGAQRPVKDFFLVASRATQLHRTETREKSRSPLLKLILLSPPEKMNLPICYSNKRND